MRGKNMDKRFIDKMIRKLKKMRNPYGLGGEIECRLQTIGTSEDVPAITRHMDMRGIPCKHVRFDAPEERLFFWVEKDGENKYQWGINAVYG
jgi:hypothetical protein